MFIRLMSLESKSEFLDVVDTPRCVELITTRCDGYSVVGQEARQRMADCLYLQVKRYGITKDHQRGVVSWCCVES